MAKKSAGPERRPSGFWQATIEAMKGTGTTLRFISILLTVSLAVGVIMVVGALAGSHVTMVL